MAATVQEYGKPGAIVLFVVQPGEKNSFDQQVFSQACVHMVTLFEEAA